MARRNGALIDADSSAADPLSELELGVAIPFPVM
jgi:hypothetical protein